MLALLCLIGGEGFLYAQADDLASARPALESALRSGDSEAKREALFRIRNMRSADASRLAVLVLNDQDELVRATAAMSAVFMPADEAVREISPLLGDRAPFVRREAAYALGKLNSPLAAAPLLTMLRGERDPEVRSAAAASLGSTGNVAAVAPLAAVLNERPREEAEFLRRSAARSIGLIAQAAAGNTVSVNTPENFLPDRFKAAASASPADLAATDPAFASALAVLERVVRSSAEAGDTRREAAFAIGAIGSPRSLPLLRSLRTNADPYLAEIAREALLRLEPGN